MQIFTVGKNEEGQRLDRLIDRLLPKAGKGFIYKMLRKKNIVLNGKRAEGSERVGLGDEVTFFLADETIVNFGDLLAWRSPGPDIRGGMRPVSSAMRDFDFASHIVYEDDDVILVNKPAGILTQKAERDDVSLNEYLIDYLRDKGELTDADMITFRPSVCNRLDRNTSGIVCCGRSMRGLRFLSEAFRDRTVRKFYLTIVKGTVREPGHLKGFIVKNEAANKVEICDAGREGAEAIETAWKPLAYAEDCTLLEVELFTGKSHQIRAHLASIGHPVAGDGKYGDVMFNRRIRDLHRVKSQLLTAYRIVFPENGVCPGVSGREFTIAVPEGFFISR